MKLPKHQEAYVKDGIVEIDLWYPRNEGANHTIEIGLVDVRAAASIRVTFDFKRNGWVILQDLSPDETLDEVLERGEDLPPDWKEVGFFHEAGPSLTSQEGSILAGVVS